MYEGAQRASLFLFVPHSFSYIIYSILMSLFKHKKAVRSKNWIQRNFTLFLTPAKIYVLNPFSKCCDSEQFYNSCHMFMNSPRLLLSLQKVFIYFHRRINYQIWSEWKKNKFSIHHVLLKKKYEGANIKYIKT